MNIIRILEKYFFIVIAIFVALGLFSWDLSKDLFEYVKPMLGIVIFAMSLTLKFEDFKPCFQKPKALLAGLGAQYLIMPAVAFMIAKLFNLPGEFAIGLILVGSCTSDVPTTELPMYVPGAMTSWYSCGGS